MSKDVYFSGAVSGFSLKPAANKQGFAFHLRTVGGKKLVLQFPLSALGELVAAVGVLLNKTSALSSHKSRTVSKKLH
jgi:hypothetical protein